MSETMHEEFDRQRLDDLYFEPPYDPDDYLGGDEDDDQP